MAESSRKRSRKSVLVPRECIEDFEVRRSDVQELETNTCIGILPKIKDQIDKEFETNTEHPNIEFSVNVEIESCDGDIEDAIDSTPLNPQSSPKLPDDAEELDRYLENLPPFLLDEDDVRKEIEKLMKITTSSVDKILEAEICNYWGQVKETKIEPSREDCLVLNALEKWRIWVSLSKIRNDISVYICYMCKVGFWNLYPFKEHLKEHDDDIQVAFRAGFHECQIFAHSDHDVTLNDIQIEGNCWKCQKDFQSHNFIEYMCKGCGISLRTTCLLLEEHESTCYRYLKMMYPDMSWCHEMFQCPICKLKCLTLERYNTHMTHRHAVRSDAPVQWPIMKSCGQCFQKYLVYNLHNCPTKPSNIACNFCRRRFANRLLLHQHEKYTQSDHFCSVCHKYFRKKCMEVAHIWRHSGNYVAMYKCVLCTELILFSTEAKFSTHWFVEHKRNNNRRKLYYDLIIVPKKIIASKTSQVKNIAEEYSSSPAARSPLDMLRPLPCLSKVPDPVPPASNVPMKETPTPRVQTEWNSEKNYDKVKVDSQTRIEFERKLIKIDQNKVRLDNYHQIKKKRKCSSTSLHSNSIAATNTFECQSIRDMTVRQWLQLERRSSKSKRDEISKPNIKIVDVKKEVEGNYNPKQAQTATRPGVAGHLEVDEENDEDLEIKREHDELEELYRKSTKNMSALNTFSYLHDELIIKDESMDVDNTEEQGTHITSPEEGTGWSEEANVKIETSPVKNANGILSSEGEQVIEEQIFDDDDDVIIIEQNHVTINLDEAPDQSLNDKSLIYHENITNDKQNLEKYHKNQNIDNCLVTKVKKENVTNDEHNIDNYHEKITYDKQNLNNDHANKTIYKQNANYLLNTNIKQENVSNNEQNIVISNDDKQNINNYHENVNSKKQDIDKYRENVTNIFLNKSVPNEKQAYTYEQLNSSNRQKDKLLQKRPVYVINGKTHAVKLLITEEKILNTKDSNNQSNVEVITNVNDEEDECLSESQDIVNEQNSCPDKSKVKVNEQNEKSVFTNEVIDFENVVIKEECFDADKKTELSFSNQIELNIHKDLLSKNKETVTDEKNKNSVKNQDDRDSCDTETDEVSKKSDNIKKFLLKINATLIVNNTTNKSNKNLNDNDEESDSGEENSKENENIQKSDVQDKNDSVTEQDTSTESVETIHTKEKKLYRCGCGMESVHNVWKEHITTCSKRRKNKKGDNLNWITKKGEAGMFHCTKCDKVYDTSSLYLKHLTEHGIESLTCPECYETFPDIVKQWAHVKGHVKQLFGKLKVIQSGDSCVSSWRHGLFECRVCQQRVAEKAFYQHWESHLKLDKTPNDSATWNVDIKVEPGTSRTEDMSDISGETGTDLECWTKSYAMCDDTVQRAVKELDNLKSLGNARILQKDCQICSRKFNRVNDLKRHIIEHLVPSAMSSMALLGALYCQICGHGEHKLDRYREHMRCHASLPHYKCEMCNKSFSDSSNFTKHLKVHNPQWTCKICGAKFQANASLEKHHLAEHSQWNVLECCGKQFHSRLHLKKHVRAQHSLVPKFRCEVCGERFQTLRYKWDHEWQLHRVARQRVQCPLCGQSFRKLMDVKRHAKSVHNVKYVRAAQIGMTVTSVT